MMRPPRKCLLLRLVAVAITLVGATAARAQVPTRREIVAQQRRQMEAAFAAMPKLPQTKVDEVFALRMENKNLVCRSPLLDGHPIRQDQMRAELSGLGDLTSVQVTKILLGGKQGPMELKTFLLTSYDYSDSEVVTTTTVRSQPYYFDIERQSQVGDGYRSVRLMQQGPGAGAGRAGHVQLTVIHTTAGGGLPVSINLEAPDFYTLLREHPREADRHLRPILARLGQESLFSPDPLIAWQVFSDRWAPEARIAAEVDALLAPLDSPDFRVREAAAEKLERLGRAGASVLMHLDRAPLSVEQNMRLDRALARYTQLPPREAARLRSDPEFLLDCLYGDDPAVRAAALERLREIADGEPIEFDVDAPSAARSEVVAKLRERFRRPN